MATARQIIKQWFSNFKKPTQEHFWAWLDSFWHKNEKIPMSSVQNLEQSLQNVVTSDQFNNHINDGNAHQTLFDGKLDRGTYVGNAKDLEAAINHKVDKADGKGLSTNDFTNSDKQKLDNTADKVIVSGAVTGEVNKILTLTYSDGTALHISFQDLGIDNIADIMLNSLNFNFETGVLTGVRSDGQQLTVSLDGRYSLLEHTHQIADVSGLEDALSGKAEAGHTHAFSEITGTEDIATKQDVTDAVISGRNLLMNSRNEIALYSFESMLTDPLIEGETYTLSFEAKGNLTGRVFLNGSVSAHFPAINTSEYKRIAVTFIYKRNDYLGNQIYPHIYGASHTRKRMLVKGNNSDYWSPAPEDFYAEISTTILKTSTNIATTTLVEGYPQNGRTVVTQSTANIVVTVDSADGFASSYQKGGTGSITFQAAQGKTLVQVDGTNVVDGTKGSTATVTVVGNEVLLRISNV